jgi:Cadherin domain
LNEEQPIGTILTTLQATDADSTISEYKIDENPYFDINNITGLVKTKSRIDYEQIKEIKFIATVTDTGIPQLTSTAQIVVEVININDNDPVFDAAIYSMDVLENAPKGTFIGQIHAKDNDDGKIIIVFCGISFYISPLHNYYYDYNDDNDDYDDDDGSGSVLESFGWKVFPSFIWFWGGGHYTVED